MKKKKHFPISMFATAGIVSGLMVFTISAVFNQAHQPCLNSFAAIQNSAVHHNLVVNTSGTRVNNSQHNNDTLEPLLLCNRNNQQISWLTWLFKRSDSAQFHYLDLLELLSRK
jgi:hypothetical protein